MTTALLSLPLWIQFLAGFVLLGLGLVFILMPFSVFGVKPRLEEVELQLNEVRAELRIIAMRLAQGGGETGPSGEPVYAPPKRGTNQAEERSRTSEPMPWSSEAGKGASPRPVVQRAETPPEERRDRPVLSPSARDDYSHLESTPRETVQQILRPTHFDPPPPREAPRPPRPAGRPGEDEYTSSVPRTEAEPLQNEEDAWRLKLHRQEMSPRAAAAAAEKMRQNDETIMPRRSRSEPTLRWPPRQ